MGADERRLRGVVCRAPVPDASLLHTASGLVILYIGTLLIPCSLIWMIVFTELLTARTNGFIVGKAGFWINVLRFEVGQNMHTPACTVHKLANSFSLVFFAIRASQSANATSTPVVCISRLILFSHP